MQNQNTLILFVVDDKKFQGKVISIKRWKLGNTFNIQIHRNTMYYSFYKNVYTFHNILKSKKKCGDKLMIYLVSLYKEIFFFFLLIVK